MVGTGPVSTAPSRRNRAPSDSAAAAVARAATTLDHPPCRSRSAAAGGHWRDAGRLRVRPAAARPPSARQSAAQHAFASGSPVAAARTARSRLPAGRLPRLRRVIPRPETSGDQNACCRRAQPVRARVRPTRRQRGPRSVAHRQRTRARAGVCRPHVAGRGVRRLPDRRPSAPRPMHRAAARRATSARSAAASSAPRRAPGDSSFAATARPGRSKTPKRGGSRAGSRQCTSGLALELRPTLRSRLPSARTRGLPTADCQLPAISRTNSPSQPSA